MFLTLTIVLGLAYAVNARDCLTPSFVEDFSMKRFEGDWKFVGQFIGNKTEADYYGSMTCAYQGYKIKNKDLVDYHIRYYIGDKLENLIGTYTLAEPNKAMFVGGFTREESIIYNLTVVCTDYARYAVVYACSQIEPGHISEHIALLEKDNRSYEDLISSTEISECLKDLVKPPGEQLRKVMFNNCPHT